MNIVMENWENEICKINKESKLIGLYHKDGTELKNIVTLASSFNDVKYLR